MFVDDIYDPYLDIYDPVCMKMENVHFVAAEMVICLVGVYLLCTHLQPVHNSCCIQLQTGG